MQNIMIFSLLKVFFKGNVLFKNNTTVTKQQFKNTFFHLLKHIEF